MQGLSCINPVDGRYRQTTAPLQAFFSEEALIRYRIYVEVEYFIALCRLPLPQLSKLTNDDLNHIRGIASTFSENDAVAVKEIEKETRHDIKAVEYFIRKKFDDLGYGQYKEFVHFGLTSQDINNTAFPLSLQDALSEVMYPALSALLSSLKQCVNNWLDIPMLARTHGQPASPTTVGKEFMVFYDRLQTQIRNLQNIPMPCKFGGATGNFNAHHVAYPDIDWVAFANDFTENLGLRRSAVTTQIDHYDQLGAIFDALKRLATIIKDLCRDCWSYVSMDYFKQKITASEVGSSAMPHKVNPIDFENAEGNAGMAVAVFEHLSAKLPVSRLQRDLSDSTVLRNIGVPVAHLLITLTSTVKGLHKLQLNKEQIRQDLQNNMAVVAEAIQTVLRTLDYPEPYEALKTLTRQNKPITEETLNDFIDGLEISQEQKERLKKITPFNYTGINPKPID
ncbi:MAG: adenylosuccinate lyase [Bacteroidota bacterium]